MQHLNWLDYAIIVIVTLSAVISLIRGFLREALSLATWILAFWVSFTFAEKLSSYLQNYIHAPTLRYAVAFFVLFVLILLIGALINGIIFRLAEKTGLSGTDRLLGVIFGFARGVLLVAILLIIAQVTALPQKEVWKQSNLRMQFTPITQWLMQYVPENLQSELNESQIQLKPPSQNSETGKQNPSGSNLNSSGSAQPNFIEQQGKH